MLVLAIQNIGSIKFLDINMKGYPLDSFQDFRNLTHLCLNVKMDALKLAEYCKTNPNLISLKFMNSEICGKLSDILPYCNNLQTLAFMVKSDFDNSEYISLAQLPKLCDLHIEGEHKPGSLNTLIKALARKEPKTLSKLVIGEASIDCAEIAEVLKIHSLEECQFSGIAGNHSIIFAPNSAQLTLCFKTDIDIIDLADLVSLVDFTSLLIVGTPRSGTLKTLFKTICSQTSPKLKELKFTTFESFNKDVDVKKSNQYHDTAFSNSFNKFAFLNNEEVIEIIKIKSLRVAELQIGDAQTIEDPSQLSKIEELYIRKSEGGSLKNLFKAFAMQDSSKLTILTISGFPLDSEEILEIAQIKSLTQLECGFSDLKSINLLTQLRQLELLCISSEHPLTDISEAVLMLYVAFNGDISICSAESRVNMNKHLRALFLTMSNNINSSVFVPLSNLPNLSNLIIYGSHGINSLMPLLEAFASKQSTVLQELSIEMDAISYEEASQIARIKTLRHLDCGFSDPKSIKLLRYLPKLESLIINSMHDLHEIGAGVLNVLTECANEVTVIRFGRQITFNKSLGKLIISNISYDNEVFDAEEYALLAELSDLNTLHIIGEHKSGSFKYLFKALAAKKHSTLQELIVEAKSNHKKTSIDLEETAEVVKISTLNKLKCGFSDGECIDFLAQLRDLQELVITTNPDGALVHLLHKQASRKSSKLQCLSLENKTLSPEETVQVASVNSLRKLAFGFLDGRNVELIVGLNKLEELTIALYEGTSISLLFQTLASSTTLQYLNIENVPISYEETMAVIEIKTLKRLNCEFTNINSIELLDQLPELHQLAITFQHNDNEIIETIAQLKKLTDLEITSPKIGCLAQLFKKLSLRLEPTLQSVVIKNNDSNLKEMEQIVKLNSLRRLQCGIFEEENLSYLIHLRNLEVLEITSYHNLEDISNYLLMILQECYKLKTIGFHYCTRYVSIKLFSDIMRILKEVRNANKQPPLLLRIPYFGGLTPEQMTIADDKYLIISRFTEDSQSC
ncbi:uncharacterized protein LOC116806499 [Drosophila grimshawi]|uniref:uncharacterized protein LOC116806499 n=1 Tax=Drosophila grimshawi TaxID=7222 RepID=UPI000C86E509|nr:uncharacterized protein LOC116806499 [Drosophila grimshawi]